MSKNLYKARWVVVKEDSRAIDNNLRMAKKLEEYEKRAKYKETEPDPDGFTQGLVAEQVDPLFEDTEALEHGGLIKSATIPNEEEIQAQIESMLADAQSRAEAIIADANVQAKAEAERVKDTAREQGYQDGMAQAQREAQEIEAQLQMRANELEASYQEQLQDMEPAIVDALTDIYEHIFDVELQQYRHILIQLISSTMRRVEENKNFLVHVSQEDYAFVSMNKKTLQEIGGSGRANVEVVEDITLGKNQCMLETENGIFDCGLDTQLSELTRKLRLLSYERKSE